jgi:hypothetical protein
MFVADLKSFAQGVSVGKSHGFTGKKTDASCIAIPLGKDLRALEGHRALKHSTKIMCPFKSSTPVSLQDSQSVPVQKSPSR